VRVVIAGGTGLIGRALSTELAAEADSHEVIVLSRAPERATDLPRGTQAVRWDARTVDGWASLVDGADAIVNLAGVSTLGWWTAERKRRMRESRLNAGQALVEAVARARIKPRVLIQASGVGYYGFAGDTVLTEASAPGDDFSARLAVDWEASTAPVHDMGVRHVVTRSGLVFSRRGGAFPLMLLPFRFFLGGSMGSGKQWFPWIHIADEVRAMRFLIAEERAHGPHNLTAPDLLTHLELMRALGRAMRRPSLLRVPAFAVRLVLGQMSTLLLYGQRAVPRRLLDLGFEFRFPTADGALQDLLA
jgi:uncharacterized protein (TIGR01777 family)